MSELRTMPFMVSSDNTLKVQCRVPCFKILLSNIYTIITTLYIYTILYCYIFLYTYIYFYIYKRTYKKYSNFLYSLYYKLFIFRFSSLIRTFQIKIKFLLNKLLIFYYFLCKNDYDYPFNMRPTVQLNTI